MRECERARKNLLDDTEYLIKVASICHGRDYQCAVSHVDHTKLLEDRSPRMRNLKERIEKRSRASSGDELEIIMIILIGSWNCSKHNEVIVGRCIGCAPVACAKFVPVLEANSSTDVKNVVLYFGKRGRKYKNALSVD